MKKLSIKCNTLVHEARSWELQTYTRESHWSRIEWFDMESNNCRKIEHWERIFCYDLRLTSQRPARHKKVLSLLTRRAHSRRNERLNAHINAFGDYHHVYINFVCSHSAFWQQRTRWGGSQGWEMTLFVPHRTTTALSIINHSILSHLHLSEWLSVPWWHFSFFRVPAYTIKSHERTRIINEKKVWVCLYNTKYMCIICVLWWWIISARYRLFRRIFKI